MSAGNITFLHPALRRLWWQSARGWLKRIALILATPGGLVVGLGLLLVLGAIFQEGLRAQRPFVESVDPTGVVSMILFAVFAALFSNSLLANWACSADAGLFNTPLPRKQILLYTLLRRLAITAFCSAPVALMLDSHFYFDLYFRLASFGLLSVSGFMLLSFALAKLSPRARLAVDLLFCLPLIGGAFVVIALVGLRLAGLEAARLAFRTGLFSLHLNVPFARFVHWAGTPGLGGAALVAGTFLLGTLIFSFLLVHFFEPGPEETEDHGLASIFAKPREAIPRFVPALPRLGGAGSIIRVQLLSSTNKLRLFAFVAAAQLPILESTSTGKTPGPTSLSVVLLIAAFSAMLSESSLKRVLLDHLERFKSMPIDPRPLLAASLVMPVLESLLLAGLSLLPSLLIFPRATLALPLLKFLFTLLPLVIFVTAAAQTIILTIHQQFQRLTMAKRWYQEAAYVASLLMASCVAFLLLFLIVAPTIAWREAPWSTSAVIASIQLVGTTLMFWYARVSYGLIEVVSHTD